MGTRQTQAYYRYLRVPSQFDLDAIQGMILLCRIGRAFRYIEAEIKVVQAAKEAGR